MTPVAWTEIASFEPMARIEVIANTPGSEVANAWGSNAPVIAVTRFRDGKRRLHLSERCPRATKALFTLLARYGAQGSTPVVDTRSHSIVITYMLDIL